MVIDEIRCDFTQLQSDIANGPILPTVTAEEIRTYLASRYDFKRTLPLEEVIADVEKMLRTWQVQVTHPRYFGLFNPSVTLASVVADTLVAMYNPQLANWRTSPAANEIERHTLGWLAAKFGLPAKFHRDLHQWRNGGESLRRGCRFDPGLPRIWRTRSAAPGGDADDLSDSRSPSRVQQDRAHDGAWTRGAADVATDSDLKMDVSDLQRQVAEDRKNGFAPFMVIGTAGRRQQA